MSGQSLVDLLLVRLRKDEEKETVRLMLINTLGMSPEEAAESVASTPVLLSKSMPMEEARVIQEKMYPFIDLLPREYGGSASEAVPPPPPKAEEPAEVDGDDGSYVQEFENDSGLTHTRVENLETPYDALEGERDDGLQGDDAFVITSASDEMLTIDRCHVCGRTPTTVEKLAPCRTCGALTCSDCFDRIVHVCSKCAAEGRMVDRPIKGQPEYRKQDETDSEEPVPLETRKGRRRVSPVLLALMGIAVLAAVFYVLDPLSLFGSAVETPGEPIQEPLQDTLTEPSADSLAIAVDTISRDTVLSVRTDSLLTAAVDSSAADSIQPGAVTPLADLRLPDDFVIPEELIPPTLLLSTPVEGLEILSDSLALISYNLSCLMSAASVLSDGVTMVRTPDGSELLILTILHPEPLQERMRLVSDLASLLGGSPVDQMVIYYRESEYHTPELFSLVADSFQVIAGTIAPGFIHSRQTSLPGTWDMVSGPIMDWMMQLN
jgi:hypothetical protein